MVVAAVGEGHLGGRFVGARNCRNLADYTAHSSVVDGCAGTD